MRVFEDNGDGHMMKYPKVLEETQTATSTNRGFLNKNEVSSPTSRPKKVCVFVAKGQQKQTFSYASVKQLIYFLILRSVQSFFKTLIKFLTLHIDHCTEF